VRRRRAPATTTTSPHKHSSPADNTARHSGGNVFRILRPADAPGGGYSGSWLPAPREEGELWEGEEGEEGGRCAHVGTEKGQMSRRGDGWAEVNQHAHTHTHTHTHTHARIDMHQDAKHAHTRKGGRYMAGGTGRIRAHRHASRRKARRQAATRAAKLDHSWRERGIGRRWRERGRDGP
jgi:hypothetical protein